MCTSLAKSYVSKSWLLSSGSSIDVTAEEPEFASALLRFYHDVIAAMGALQVVPSFMAS